MATPKRSDFAVVGTLYSIGHSNQGIDEFIALLHAARIETLVDVRARPASRRNPQFNEAALRESLAAAGVRYHWAGRQLGGMRRSRADSAHHALAGSGLQSYADHMESEEFARSASQLARMAKRGPTVMMCAEREPLDCHRSLIADWLALRGMQVVHLIGRDDQRAHVLRAEARRESAQLVYDRNTQKNLL